MTQEATTVTEARKELLYGTSDVAGRVMPDADARALREPDSVPAMGRLRFTYSLPTRPFVGATQIKTYLRKPRAWWATYVAGLPEPETVAQKFGTTLHAVLERWGLREENMYPPGWAADVTPVEADLIKRLAESAIGGSIVGRGEGLAQGFDRDVEAKFCLPILEPEDGKPGVDVRGTIDCPRSFGIDDYKTTKSIARYAKEGHELATDVQLNLYAYAWLHARRAIGLWDPSDGIVRVRHVYFEKGARPAVEVREAQVTVAQVEERWEKLKPVVRQMRDLAWAHLVDGDEFVGDRWYQVPCVVASEAERHRVLGGELACGDYGGCGYAGLCADVEDLADYRMKVSSNRNGNGGGSSVNIFGDRIAALQGAATATSIGNGNGAATTAPSAPPAAAPPAATAPAPAPSAPSGPRLREFAPGSAPWTRPECGACVDKAIDKVTGVRFGQAGACFICSSKNKAEGKLHGDMFEHAYDNGLHIWAVKTEFADKVPEGLRQGSYRTAQATQVVVAPTPPAAPAPAPTPAAPPPRDPTPTLTALPAQQAAPSPAPAPASAPTPTAAAPVAPVADAGKPAKHKFTLCVGCGPDGEKAIRLEVVHRKYADLLAQEYSERLKSQVLFTDIPAFERWDKMAARAAAIVEAEKFGSGWVVCYPDKGGDLARFVEAVAPFAATVIRARGQGNEGAETRLPPRDAWRAFRHLPLRLRRRGGGAHVRGSPLSPPGWCVGLRRAAARGVVVSEPTEGPPRPMITIPLASLADAERSVIEATLASLADAERSVIEATLAAVGHNLREAAKCLGCSRSALYQKIKRHGLARRGGTA